MSSWKEGLLGGQTVHFLAWWNEPPSLSRGPLGRGQAAAAHSCCCRGASHRAFRMAVSPQTTSHWKPHLPKVGYRKEKSNANILQILVLPAAQWLHLCLLLPRLLMTPPQPPLPLSSLQAFTSQHCRLYLCHLHILTKSLLFCCTNKDSRARF